MASFRPVDKFWQQLPIDLSIDHVQLGTRSFHTNGLIRFSKSTRQNPGAEHSTKRHSKNKNIAWTVRFWLVPFEQPPSPAQKLVPAREYGAEWILRTPQGNDQQSPSSTFSSKSPAIQA
uniref:Uncharacterized protein n=1 Tax=Anopheles melas TaxID=34690 RepID=A0A182UG33_9DIPT